MPSKEGFDIRGGRYKRKAGIAGVFHWIHFRCGNKFLTLVEGCERLSHWPTDLPLYGSDSVESSEVAEQRAVMSVGPPPPSLHLH